MEEILCRLIHETMGFKYEMKSDYSEYFALQYGQVWFLIDSLYGVAPRKRLQEGLGHT